MGILLMVAIGVVRQQSRINPAVRALRPETHQTALSPLSAPPALIETDAAGVVPFSPPEQFGPATLYEKINGRAELYLASGFVSLAAQRFSAAGAAGSWVEVFVYDMASAENAFAVFSMQRREDAQGDDIAPHAYRTANALFMTHANFYLEFIGTDDSPALRRLTETLARAFMATRGAPAQTRPPGAELFPDPHAEPNSLQLIAADAFGYESLDKVYTRAYTLDGIRLTAFVSRRPDATAAAALAETFAGTLVSYGAVRLEEAIPIDGAIGLQFFDTYEIIFTRGPFMAGIHEAARLEAGLRLAGQLAAHLETLAD